MRATDFESHPLWGRIDSVVSKANDADVGATADLPPMASDIRMTAAYATSFREVDAALFSRAMLDEADTAWTQAESALTTHESNPAAGYLAQAATVVENSLAIYGRWPQPTARGGAAARANRLFDDYRESAEAALASLRTSAAAAQADIEARLASLKDELAEAASALGQTGAGNADITARQADLRAQIEAALTDHEQRFREAQSKRDDDYRSWVQEQGEAFEGKLKPYVDQAAKYDADAASELKQIRERHAEVEKAAGKAASSILARDYGAYSTREWLAGVVAYVLGVAILLGAAVYLIDVLRGIKPNEHLSWPYVTLKLGLTVTAAAAAAVAIQFATRSMQRSNTSKRVELELRAIGPFLSDVDDAEAKAAKVDFVNRTFGRGWDSEQPGADDNINVKALGGLGDALDGILKAFRRSQ